MELLRLRAQRLSLCLLLFYAASKAAIVAWLRHRGEVLARRRRALPGFSRCQQRAVEQAHSGVQSKAFVARLVSVTVYGRILAFFVRGHSMETNMILRRSASSVAEQFSHPLDASRQASLGAAESRAALARTGCADTAEAGSCASDHWNALRRRNCALHHGGLELDQTTWHRHSSLCQRHTNIYTQTVTSCGFQLCRCRKASLSYKKSYPFLGTQRKPTWPRVSRVRLDPRCRCA